MPFAKLNLQPGCDTQRSQTLNQTNFFSASLCRFYNGLIQSLGGWQQIAATPFLGTCRGMHSWSDIQGNSYIAVGTEQRLSLVAGGGVSDITPLAYTSMPPTSITTTASSQTVSVNDAAYTPNVGDWIDILIPAAIGGIVLQGFYQVQTVSAPSYTITIPSAATSSVSGAATVPQFTTTNGSMSVTVTLANHGLVQGGLFTVQVSTAVGGVTLSGVYSVVSVTDANNFVITASNAATSSTNAHENAGHAEIQYLIPVGDAVATALIGFGAGDYGAGDYGLAGTSQAYTRLRQWSLDHWGAYLIASPSGGGIYYWAPPTPAAPVVLSATAPLYSTAVFVMPEVQIIVALGAETGGTQEPQLVRWCDAGDFTDWTASATNQAGSYELATGNRLVGGLASGLGALLWTDTDLTVMSYQGLPYVFGFNRIATGCGLIAQRAAGIVGNFVMWLSWRGFFAYSMGGAVSPVPCAVWDFFIDNVDLVQSDQIHCAPNALYQEMAWFFPLSTSSPYYSAQAPLAYVKFNYMEKVWDYGVSAQYQRTAWMGISPGGFPLGTDLAGLIMQHETGYDANGVAMQGSWETGYFDLAQGEQFAFVDLMIPDFVTEGSPTLNLTVYVTDYPNSAPVTVGPFAISPTTPFVPLRLRGRQMAIGMSWNSLGGFNRLGALRYRVAPDGRN